MSARRIVLRRAYLEQVRSVRKHAEFVRQCKRQGLPKPADRMTFSEWLRSKAPLRTPA